MNTSNAVIPVASFPLDGVPVDRAALLPRAVETVIAALAVLSSGVEVELPGGRGCELLSVWASGEQAIEGRLITCRGSIVPLAFFRESEGPTIAQDLALLLASVSGTSEEREDQSLSVTLRYARSIAHAYGIPISESDPIASAYLINE